MHIGVAAIYGPLIWIVMSFVVIQLLTGRSPTYRARSSRDASIFNGGAFITRWIGTTVPRR
jgi:hypothetical protein